MDLKRLRRLNVDQNIQWQWIKMENFMYGVVTHMVNLVLLIVKIKYTSHTKLLLLSHQDEWLTLLVEKNTQHLLMNKEMFIPGGMVLTVNLDMVIKIVLTFQQNFRIFSTLQNKSNVVQATQEF
jgi:hypothetical protein